MFKKHNRIIVAIIILTLLISSFTFAGGTKQTIEVMFNSVNLEVNGQKVEADTIAFDGVTYVPLRATAEMLGKEVGWNQATQTASIDDKVEEKPVEKKPEKPVTEDKNMPKEYQSALTKADRYANQMHMSKAGLYNQLTSEYGENFSKDAAQYAVDNVDTDWKYNALQKAIRYQDQMAMSPNAIHDQLTSEYGEKFTKEEADYAIKNLPK